MSASPAPSAYRASVVRLWVARRASCSLSPAWWPSRLSCSWRTSLSFLSSLSGGAGEFLFQNSPNVGQRHHQRHRLTRARIEAKREIEALRLLRYCVNHDTANSYRVGRLRHAARGIAKQSAANASTVPVQIHGQPSQHGHRNRVGHIPPEPARSIFDRDDTGSQRIIANHMAAIAQI